MTAATYAAKPREALASMVISKGSVHRTRAAKETEAERLARRETLLAAIRAKHARAVG